MVDVGEADLVLAALLDVLHLQEGVVSPPLRLGETHIDAVIQIVYTVLRAFPCLLLGEAGLVDLLEGLLLLQEGVLIALSEHFFSVLDTDQLLELLLLLTDPQRVLFLGPLQLPAELLIIHDPEVPSLVARRRLQLLSPHQPLLHESLINHLDPVHIVALGLRPVIELPLGD